MALGQGREIFPGLRLRRGGPNHQVRGGWPRPIQPAPKGDSGPDERIRDLLDRLGEDGILRILEAMAEDAGLSAMNGSTNCGTELPKPSESQWNLEETTWPKALS